MNTKPDEATLALWLDDELTGENLTAVEAWAVTEPVQIAAREGIRQWRAMLVATLPASEEPPFADFFNSRVLQAIHAQPALSKVVRKPRFLWNSWLMPLGGCAGMALAFWVGKNSQSLPEYDVAGAPRAIPVEPDVYTPESGVEAKWYSSKDAAATVIVLNGVAAIPDTTEFPPSADIPVERDSNSTAVRDAPPPIEIGP